MTHLAVIHLARGSNDERALREFLESYARHPAGIEHTFAVAMKGYEAIPEALERDVARCTAAGAVILPLARDDRFDIGAYYDAAEVLQADYYLFLNSFSRILADNWLALLYGAVRQPGVGVAAATGSWEGLPTCYVWSALYRRRPQDFVRAIHAYFRMTPLTPNPHLRANSFIIQREDFLAIPQSREWSKPATLRFECGRNSMTRRFLRRGLKAVVVGRDGRAYEAPDWPHSKTYRSGLQSNLIIEDNRTRQYLEAPPEERRGLESIAWGKSTEDVEISCMPRASQARGPAQRETGTG